MLTSALPSSFFFFNDTATTEIYTLSLHDALPICRSTRRCARPSAPRSWAFRQSRCSPRSEEHTSELQSRSDLVCRLLLEKKKKTCPPTSCSSTSSHRAHDPPCTQLDKSRTCIDAP